MIHLSMSGFDDNDGGDYGLPAVSIMYLCHLHVAFAAVYTGLSVDQVSTFFEEYVSFHDLGTMCKDYNYNYYCIIVKGMFSALYIG